METNEFQKMLEDDPDLASKLEEALKGNATVEELSGILAAADVDAATAEAILAEYQHKRGAAIGAQELDDEALDMVSGGGTGNSCYAHDDCDKNFKEGCDHRMYHPNEDCHTMFSCYAWYQCDETIYWERYVS